jgi:TonB family protein
MRRAAWLLAFLSIGWTPKSWQRGEMVENPRWHSPNGRFCLVLRQYDRVGDFDAKPAEVVFRWDEPRPDPAPPPPEDVAGALYDGNHLIAEFPIRGRYAHRFVVADSGNYVVAGGWPGGDAIAAIFHADGTLVRELTAEAVFTENDRSSLARDVELSLRDDILVLAANESEIRIDLATGNLLDPKRDIFPTWRTWTTGDFADHALYRLLPEYPEVAKKARIAGTVIIEVSVGASGQVIDTRILKPLPFGLDTAAESAARKWLFMPGRAASGRIEFHFRALNDDQWREIVLPSRPPL